MEVPKGRRERRAAGRATSLDRTEAWKLGGLAGGGMGRSAGRRAHEEPEPLSPTGRDKAAV